MSLTDNTELIADKSTEIKNEPQKKEIQSPSNFNDNLKNISSNDSKRELKDKDELKFFGISEFYIKEISEELISKYGNFPKVLRPKKFRYTTF